MLSQSAAYAIRAVVLLAREDPAGDPVPVDRIAGKLGAPRNYLSKVLHVLAGSGVVASKRGPGGGFSLAIPATQLTLARVVAAFEPMEEPGVCLLGRGRCSEERPCEAHALWSPLANEVGDFFHRLTVADLLAEAAPP
jgi:Rrf2 family protein